VAMKYTDDFYAAAERRIEYLTVGIGIVATIAVAVHWGIKTGLGLAIGAALSWINFRWMKQGVTTLALLSVAQEHANKVRVPKRIYFKFLGRYVLVIAGAYVILRGFDLPVASLLAGFGAVVVAMLSEMIGQLFRKGPEARADS
jgi:small-conductance mechanosensitive channel